MSRESSRPRHVAQLLDEAWASRRANLSVNFHSEALTLTSGLRPSISHGAVPEAACIGLRLFAHTWPAEPDEGAVDNVRLLTRRHLGLR
jgi:hypothetical protein